MKSHSSWLQQKTGKARYHSLTIFPHILNEPERNNKNMQEKMTSRKTRNKRTTMQKRNAKQKCKHNANKIVFAFFVCFLRCMFLHFCLFFVACFAFVFACFIVACFAYHLPLYCNHFTTTTPLLPPYYYHPTTATLSLPPCYYHPTATLLPPYDYHPTSIIIITTTTLLSACFYALFCIFRVVRGVMLF